MSEFEQGQQFIIDKIKRELIIIEKTSKDMDIVFDLLELLKSLKVEPRN
jgi:hypothetical protein